MRERESSIKSTRCSGELRWDAAFDGPSACKQETQASRQHCRLIKPWLDALRMPSIGMRCMLTKQLSIN